MSKNILFALLHFVLLLIIFAALWYLGFMVPLGKIDRGLISVVVIPETKLGYSVYKTSVFNAPLVLVPLANLLLLWLFKSRHQLTTKRLLYSWIVTFIVLLASLVLWRSIFEVNWV